MRSSAQRPGFGDPLLMAAVMGLALFGIAMVFSAGELDAPSAVTGIWRRQVVWLALSLLVLFGVVRIPVRWLDWLAPIAYVASLLGLLLVLAVASGDGPRSWIRFGGLGLQPSEFAKIGTVLMLARLMAGRRSAPESLWELLPFAGVVFLPMGLILLQPDAGTAAVFLALLLAAFYWSGVPVSRLLLVLSPIISLALAFSTTLWGVWFLLLIAFIYFSRPYLSESVVTVLANIAMGMAVRPAWESLAPYQQDRILAFLRPEADPQGAGWHLIQSQVAIGSGGWTGKGFTLGTQKRLAFLPEQHTDFIIAVVGEELGFLGICAILVAFGLVLWRVVRGAELIEDPFPSMVVFGIFAIWFAHLVANVGMTVGLLPITGLPLPFLSYGGSFLMVSFTALAMVQRIISERRIGT